MHFAEYCLPNFSIGGRFGDWENDTERTAFARAWTRGVKTAAVGLNNVPADRQANT